MEKISIKLDIKILIILAFALILGFFILPNSVKAQCIAGGGSGCNGTPCCSGWECVTGLFGSRCMRPLGYSCSYTSPTNQCYPTTGDNYMGCNGSDQCCGRHWYPCSDDSACCNDPSGAGAFSCYVAGGGYCVAWCWAPYCNDWTNRGCGQGGCPTSQIWRTRTCNNVVCHQSECVTDCSCNIIASSQCYNNDRYWYDACGNRTNNIRQDCGDDGCDAWVVNGCNGNFINEIQTCHDRGCSNDACFDNVTTNTRNGADCGGNYCGNWAATGCNGNFIEETRTCHSRGCSNGACFDTPSTETRNGTDCRADSCDAWTATGCDGNYIQESRTCHDRGCNNGACFDNTSPEARRSTDCNTLDACVGTTYRDYTCSAGACTYNSLTCDSRCDNPPAIPTLISPSNNAWINTDPIFQANVSDSQGENARAHFNLLNNPDGIGSWTTTGTTSQWGPVINLGTCVEDWWQARTEDACLFFSNWSGWWRVRVDKDLPISSISYPSGIINTLDFTVTLGATENCSGISTGDVDVSTDHGNTWTNQGLPSNGPTTNNFTYTGAPGQCYIFRYRVQDLASNWSNYAQGGEICIDTSIPTCSIDYPDGWINTVPFNVALTEDDPGGSIAQGNVDIQSKQESVQNWPIWSDHSDTINDFTYTGQNCYFYKFRYQARDNAGNWSQWSDPGYITRIDTVSPRVNINYPTGIINSLTLAINLSDSDDCSGIAERDLEISIDNGAWQDYSTGGASFNYIGSYGHTYKFRYRARDVASNWSDYMEGGTVELKALPTANPSNVNWIFCPSIDLGLSWNYSDINNLPQISFQMQIDNNNDFSSPIFDSQQISDSRNSYIVPRDTLPQLMNQTKYYWRIRVRNSADDWSSWNSDLNLPIFFKNVRNYSTFY